MGFEIWQKMHKEFNINKPNSTVLDFMFVVMKKEEIIHTNIGNKDIQN